MKGPYSAATNGPKYYLTIKCTFSNKFWALPMCTANGDTVKKTLFQFFINNGHPRKIKFDQGTNFRDSKVQEFLRQRYIEIEYASIENPNSLLVEGSHSKWNRLYPRNSPESVDKILAEMNNTPVRTKDNQTPDQLFYGYKRFQHDGKDPYVPERVLVDKIKDRVAKRYRGKVPRVPDIADIDSIWLKDLGQKKVSLYKKINGKPENLIEEITNDWIVLYNGNRGYKRVSRRNCKLIPKIT